MKALNNLSIKVKLLVLTIPLIVCIIASVIFASVQINNSLNEATKVYNDTLYFVNNELVNADRDYYQALLGATQYYELANGYTTMSPEEFLHLQRLKATDLAETISFFRTCSIPLNRIKKRKA